MLKIRTSPLEERKTSPINAIQVQIKENIRMLAKIKDRWAREKEEEERVRSLATPTTITTIQVVEDLKTFSTHHTPSPEGWGDGRGGARQWRRGRAAGRGERRGARPARARAQARGFGARSLETTTTANVKCGEEGVCEVELTTRSVEA